MPMRRREIEFENYARSGSFKKTWMELDYPRVAIDDSSTRLEGQNLTIAATLAGQPQVMR
jgi:hypothetical protein